MDNALANPLLEDSNPLANTAANDLATDRPARLSSDMTYDQFLDWYDGSGIQNQYSTYRETKGWDEWTGDSAPPYERNEAGRYVNESGEELFYYTGPDYETEYKNGAGLNADADYMTMADIEAKYNEDTVLNKVFDSVEDYKAYIVERQDLIDQGVIMDKWEKENQLWNDPFFRRRDGRGGPNADAMSDILQAETERREGAERDAYAQLNDKYGVQTDIVDHNGNKLRWNGSGYSLIERYKEDDKWGNKLAWAAGGAMLTAALGPALTGALGSTAGSAAASAISNSAMQLMQDGKLSLQEAVMAGATAALGDVVANQLEGVLGTATETVWDDNTITNMSNVLVENGTFDTIQEAYQYVMENGPNAGASIADAIGNLTSLGTDIILGDDGPEYEVDYGGANPDETDITDETTQNADGTWNEDFGFETEIDMPTIDPVNPNTDGDGGGSDSADGSEGGSQGGDASTGTDDNGGAPDWVWDSERGVWTNSAGEYIEGPPNETGEMTDEEMNEAWETGDYSWGTYDPNDANVVGDGNEGGEGSEETGNDVVLPPIPDVGVDVGGGTTDGGGTSTGTGDGTSTDGTADQGNDVDLGPGDVTTGDGTDGEGESGDNGDGDGNDGEGQGDGGQGFGQGMLAGLASGGDRDRPTWGPLFPATPFRAKPKAKPSIGRRLFDELFRGNGL